MFLKYKSAKGPANSFSELIYTDLQNSIVTYKI